MFFLRPALAALCVCLLPFSALAQSEEAAPSGLLVELNTVQDVEQACRLTFVVENGTGSAIDVASYEAVIFDTSGGVVRLTLFNFRDLPEGRLRVRQFDLPGIACNTVGKVLFNGANACTVAEADSLVCHKALKLKSRTEVELIG